MNKISRLVIRHALSPQATCGSRPVTKRDPAAEKWEKDVQQYMRDYGVNRAIAEHDLRMLDRTEASLADPRSAPRPTPAVTAPRAPDFEKLVAIRAKEKKIGMAQAMSEVARERPDLYALHKHVLQRNADLRGEVDQRRRQLAVASYTADALQNKLK